MIMNIENKYQDFLAEFNKYLEHINKKATLIAVSKTKPIDNIVSLCRLGHCDFGENYAQEFRDKIKDERFSSFNIRWHFIGNIQRNKLKYIVGKSSLIHTVDSYDKAEMINDFSIKIDAVQPILLQVNISRDPKKGGVSAEEVNNLFPKLMMLKNIKINGLMTITQYSEDPENCRNDYKEMKNLSLILESKYGGSLELSMGMSNDYKVALDEGATMVRVGTKIFGERRK